MGLAPFFPGVYDSKQLLFVFCSQRSCSQMDVQAICRCGVGPTRSFPEFSRHAACQYVSGFTVLL